MFLYCRKDKCRYCRRPILLIKANNGKTGPYDPTPVHFIPDMNGPNRYVLPDGLVIWGAPPRAADPDAIYTGYISHIVTCPAAKKNRRVNK